MSYDPVAHADELLASRLREVPSLHGPTRHTIRLALLDVAQRAHDAISAAYWSFTRTKRGRPPIVTVPHAYAAQRRARVLLALLGPVTEDEHLERVAREEASRCTKCGSYPDQPCWIESDGGLCRRRVA